MRESVDQLVQGHREFLGFLERRVGDRALAEDLLQDAFVRTLEKGDGLRQRESLRAWFYRVLRNAVIDHHRRGGSRQRALEALAAELGDAPPAEVDATICQCIRTLADTLPAPQAEALRQIEVEGMAVKDFAEAQGISRSNAGVRVFRAREALRTQVARACGTCATHGCFDCTCQAHGH